MSPRPRSSSAAFTLLELLVVVALISLMGSMIAFMPQREQREAAVSGAAHELAATLRHARAMAIKRRCVIGVAFNIQNAPGSSGRVLNNWSGGHWYRLVGPRPDTTGLATPPFPGFTYDGDVAEFLHQVKNGWLGERHVLPAAKVRFLALSDQDDGTGGWMRQNRFVDTYPRPWFGWWDAASGRLYPWGGYDPTILDPNGKACSGFYFQGNDPPLAGCRNPADRLTTWNPAKAMVILAEGEARPLVNAEWLDVMIEFYPDGTAGQLSPMRHRRQSWAKKGGAGWNDWRGGVGDGDLGVFTQGSSPDAWKPPMTHYLRHTGRWTVTLAPDAVADDDVFGSAREALESIWPLYRVSVTPFGDISVDRVSSLVPEGTVFDTTAITDWQSTSQIHNRYKGFIATADSTGDLRGMPVTDFLNAEILKSRQWWMELP